MTTERPPTSVPAFYWRFIKPYKWSFILMLGLVSVMTLRETTNPYLVKLIIDGVYAGNADRAAGLPWAVLLPLILYFMIQTTNEICQILVEIIQKRIMPALKTDMRDSLFTYVQGHEPGWFQNNFAGSIANRIGLTGPATDTIIRIFTNDIYQAVFGLLTIAFILFHTQMIYGLITLAWLAFYFAVVFRMAPGISTKSKDYAAAQSVTNGHIVDVISNIASMKYFARARYERDLLGDTLARERVQEHRQRRALLIQSIFQKNLTTIIVFAMILALLAGWRNGTVTPGDFALVLFLALRIGVYAHNLGASIVIYFNEAGRIREALELISAPHGLKDKAGAQDLSVSKGEVAFENMSFTYPSGLSVFENLNLKITPGERIGLVGYSGAGKTTLVSLLLRFHDTGQGSILIDGQDIRDCTQESLRAKIGFIPQDTALFHRTLLDNIRYGDLNATEDEVIEAATQAHAHEFIAALPEGYHTFVGERGVKLSGGQRQRIAIARAILKNAPILVLDEATSALDSESERLIQDSLNRIMQGRTVIAIAHRLSTIAHLDRLIVLNQGRIVEDGSHPALLARNGVYARLWGMQSGGFLPDPGAKRLETL